MAFTRGEDSTSILIAIEGEMDDLSLSNLD